MVSTLAGPVTSTAGAAVALNVAVTESEVQPSLAAYVKEIFTSEQIVRVLAATGVVVNAPSLPQPFSVVVKPANQAV